MAKPFVVFISPVHAVINAGYEYRAIKIHELVEHRAFSGARVGSAKRVMGSITLVCSNKLPGQQPLKERSIYSVHT